MEQEPVNEVIGYGTRITTNVIDTPEGPREYWRVVHMRVTAYTAASSGKSPDHPSLRHYGQRPARGNRHCGRRSQCYPLPVGSLCARLRHRFRRATPAAASKGAGSTWAYDEDELQAWNGYVDVYYLTPMPAEINYLIPEVLP